MDVDSMADAPEGGGASRGGNDTAVCTTFSQAWEKCVAWMKELELYSGCTNCPKRPLCNVCAAAIYTENLAKDKENAYRLKPDYLCESAQCYINELAAQNSSTDIETTDAK